MNPTEARLIDRFGRVHNNLRISVTDRCNIRCVYCMPENVEFLPRASVLSFEEIARFVRVAAGMGIDKIRLTGGEPLVRRDLPRLIEAIAGIDGIKDIGLTTNGILLAPMARALWDAGLRRINVSLDTLDPDRFQALTRRTGVEQVIEGILAAKDAGFEPVKVNAVAIGGVTDADVVPLAEFARRNRLELRFIEYMPLDAGDAWERSKVLPAEDILRLLAEGIGPLIEDAHHDPRSPAMDYDFADGSGRVGIIASVTRPFCGSCNRVRLTADGKLRNCLFALGETDVRELLRDGSGDDRLAEALRESVASKWAGHQINSAGFVKPERLMHSIVAADRVVRVSARASDTRTRRIHDGPRRPLVSRRPGVRMHPMRGLLHRGAGVRVGRRRGDAEARDSPGDDAGRLRAEIRPVGPGRLQPDREAQRRLRLLGRVPRLHGVCGEAGSVQVLAVLAGERRDAVALGTGPGRLPRRGAGPRLLRRRDRRASGARLDMSDRSRESADRERLRGALRVVYDDLARDVADAGPTCELSGRCCRFKEYDHTLFLSGIEAEVLLSDAPPPCRSPGLMIGLTCPWQDDRGRCTAREARPLGCRVYFCEPRYQERSHELSERHLGRLKAIAKEHERDWDYAPLHHHLRAAIGRGAWPKATLEAEEGVVESERNAAPG